MTDASQDAALAAKQAQDSELVALKRQMDKLKNQLTPGQGKEQKLRKACQDFEAVFIGKLWEQMRATVPKSGVFNSQQEEMYRSMFDREFTEKMARDGGIGLGDMLYDQLKGKIKGAGKGTGVTGERMLNGSLVNAPVEQRGTEGKLPEEKSFAAPVARNRNAAQASVPQGSAPQTSAGAGRRTAASAAQVLDSASRTVSSAAQVLGAAERGQDPRPPASVPAADMDGVEALARRIEADYDRRQAAAGYASAGRKGAAVGSRLATIG